MYTLDENYIFVFEYKLRSHCHCSCRKFKLPPWLDLIQPIGLGEGEAGSTR